jgi:hypothetical protein
MKEVPVEIQGSNIYHSDFFKNGRMEFGSKIEIADGVFVRIDGGRLCEAINVPEFLNIAIVVSQNVALPVALNLATSWLYDRFKDKKGTKIRVNGIDVIVSKEKIREMLEKEIREKPSLEQHVFRLSLPEIEKHELLQSARTLCDKPITFDGVELPFPDNEIFFADYVSENKIEITLSIRDEVLNAFFQKRMALYAIPEQKNMGNRVFFDGLILCSKKVPSSVQIQYEK